MYPNPIYRSGGLCRTLPKPALRDPGRGSIPSSNMSTKPGPSFEEAAEGFALPAGAPNQVSVMDRGWGGVALQTPWYLPLPGRAIGSYVPPPPLDVFPDAPSSRPFIEPDWSTGGTVDPGFGMGFGSMPWLGRVSGVEAAAARATNPLDAPLGDHDMQNTASAIGSGTLGAESFLSNIASLVGDVGQTVLAYQQQKYTQRAQDKYGAPSSFSLVPQVEETVTETPPAEGAGAFAVASPGAQAEFASVPGVLNSTAPPPAAPGFNPLWLAAGGLVLLMMMRR